MAQYSLKKDGNKTTYLDGKKEVSADNVPDSVKKTLAEQRPGTKVNEDGTAVETYNGKPIETDESEDENLSGAQPSNKPLRRKSSADETDDPDGLDPTDTPVLQDEDDMGMGFKRSGGKTLSVFSNAPHETVKHVAGVMVPMTIKEYEEKTDAEIIKKLRDLKKI